MVAERRPVAAASVDGADDEEPGLGSARLIYLDNLKIVLTVGVIVAHAAMTYGAVGSWVCEEPSLSGAVEGVLSAFVGVGAMFGLGLFFLLAGMLTTAPLIRRGPRSFLASRAWRLGVPLVAYAFVVWPVLQWRRFRVEARGRWARRSFRRRRSPGTRRWSDRVPASRSHPDRARVRA